MPECLPDLPSIIRQCPDGWEGADHPDGPWRPIPAPQVGLPWQAGGPAPEGKAPATMTSADRLALTLCSVFDPATGTCATGEICRRCRQQSAAVAHEVSAILRERHGSSTTADWLDGVGCHPAAADPITYPD